MVSRIANCDHINQGSQCCNRDIGIGCVKYISEIWRMYTHSILVSLGNFGIVVKRAWIHRTVFWEHVQPLGQYKPNDCPINVIAINKIARMFIFLLLNLLSLFSSVWFWFWLVSDPFYWLFSVNERHSMEKEYVKRMLCYGHNGFTSICNTSVQHVQMLVYKNLSIVYILLLLFFVVVYSGSFWYDD